MIVILKVFGKKIPNLKALIAGKIYSKKEIEEKVIEEFLNVSNGKVSAKKLSDRYNLKYSTIYSFIRRVKPEILCKISYESKGYTIVKGTEICPECGKRNKYALLQRVKKVYFFCRNEKCALYQPIKKIEKKSEEEKIEICRKYYNLVPMKTIAKEHSCSYFAIRKCIKNYRDIVMYSKEG